MIPFDTLTDKQKELVSDIPTEYVDGKRYYVIDGLKLPSITTVLSLKSEAGISKWREKVGHEKADAISNKAKNRGTNFHTLCERYLRGEQNLFEGVMPDLKNAFKKTQREIDKITSLWHIELPLYSKVLGVAGRTDIIGRYEGEPAILDFKTSVKEKKKEYIQSYFEQETAYSLMYAERTHIQIRKIVTIFYVDDLDAPVVYIEKPGDYITSLKSSIYNYYAKYHPERIPKYAH